MGHACFSDSDYSGDLDITEGVSGFILFIFGEPVSWRSKAPRSTTLSCLEVEWMVLSKAMKEITFMI